MCANISRSRRARQDREQQQQQQRLADNELASAIDHDLLGDLEAALDELPADLRQVIEYRFFDGLSANDIASAIDAKPATVRKRQQRALSALRERLGQRGHAAIVILAALMAAGPAGAATAGAGAGAHSGAGLEADGAGGADSAYGQGGDGGSPLPSAIDGSAQASVFQGPSRFLNGVCSWKGAALVCIATGVALFAGFSPWTQTPTRNLKGSRAMSMRWPCVQGFRHPQAPPATVAGSERSTFLQVTTGRIQR